MLFNSYLFIFLFLPIALAGYYGLHSIGWHRGANLFLIGMSLWFYGYFNPRYLLILCGSILVNFLLSRGIAPSDRASLDRLPSDSVSSDRASSDRVLSDRRQGIRKLLLILGICGNTAVIFYFKYYNFFLENVNAVFRQSFELKQIVLPLGISFFTFQQISYLVDSFQGETKGYTFDEYALFVSFFPQLVAGPIVLHRELIPQFQNTNNRSVIPENFAKGMYIFALGLFKKVMIADTFGKAVALGFGSMETLSSMEAWLVSFFYTFQLFFDFSGYCDMAIGIGYLFNLELPANFRSPYQAVSITDFWGRWHMSLTRFLRTYLYIPLGGNRKGTFRTCLNVMIVYLVSGIWHGANWTFILWGILHGVLCCLNRLFGTLWEKLGEVTKWAITFLLVNVLWVLFRSESVAFAVRFLKIMGRLSSFTIRPELYQCFDLKELMVMEARIPLLNALCSRITGVHLWMFLLGAFFVVLNFRNSQEVEWKPTAARSLIVVLLMLWSVVSLTEMSVFLYFDF